MLLCDLNILLSFKNCWMSSTPKVFRTGPAILLKATYGSNETLSHRICLCFSACRHQLLRVVLGLRGREGNRIHGIWSV